MQAEGFCFFIFTFSKRQTTLLLKLPSETVILNTPLIIDLLGLVLQNSLSGTTFGDSTMRETWPIKKQGREPTVLLSIEK